MGAGALLGLAVVLLGLSVQSAAAQTRKPTAQEVAAIRNCAAKYQDNLDEVEQQCLFKLVGDPCTETPEGSSNVGTADCYRLERRFGTISSTKISKTCSAHWTISRRRRLRAMQHAWIAYRDTTCNFYWDKIQGTMAIPMSAACNARETARRAVLLQFFSRL
jgi:uncharacterized protein YecT (DUF1311 family)